MNINIYERYLVIIMGQSSYIDPESPRDIMGTDVSYLETSGYNVCEMEGGEFMNMLARDLADQWTDDVTIKKNVITISQFNPMTGESSETEYHFRKLKENEEWTSGDIIKEEK